MPSRHFSATSQELCSPLSYSTQAVASWCMRMPPQVSVSSCMTVLTTEQIPITITEGPPAAEVSVLLHGQP